MFQIDPRVIERVVQKNEQAYEQVYTKTVDILFRYVKAHYFVSNEIAEDILSDFYFKFRRVVDKYDKQYKFETYIWVVFKSVIKDFFKKNQHQYHESDLLS